MVFKNNNQSGLEQIFAWFKQLNDKKVLNFKLGDALYVSFLFVSLLVFITLMYPSGISYQYSNLKVGMIAPEKITAPFTFPILKTEDELKEEQRQVTISIKDVFKRDPNVEKIELVKFEAFREEVLNNAGLFQQYNTLMDSLPEDLNLKIDSLLYSWRTKFNLILNKRSIPFLAEILQKKRFTTFIKGIEDIFIDVYSKGIIDVPRYELVAEEIVVREENKENILGPRDFFHLEEALYHIKRKSTSTFQEDQYVELVDALTGAFVKPNLFFQPEITKKRRQDALKNIPTTRGFVYEGQLIVDKGEIITQEIYNMLRSLSVAQAEKGATYGGSGQFLFKFGQYIFNAILLMILVFYIAVFRPEKYRNPKTIFLLYLLFVIQFSLNYLFLHILNWPTLSLPLVILPILASMLIDSGSAFVATIISSFFTSGLLGFDIHFAIYTFFPGVAAIYSTRRLRKRSDTLRAVVIVLLAYAITYISLGLLRFETLREISRQMILPMAVIVISMFIVYMLIIVFERFFDATTDISLLELSDLNHPLLKELSVKSPGTFHHSLMMGNMAESAALAIRANPLLARVGCYYHDIGKMLRPEYFVENQLGAENRHESLQPNISALILKKHVLEGLELAEKHNLPSAVKSFIPEHHGTSVMTFFYHKAVEKYGEENVNKDDYRYPGPKPQSKETAIAMLADICEASVRALKNPDTVKIKQQIDDVIKAKFTDGQFDECNLTLRDLTKVSDAFLTILRGSVHERIEYPKDSPDESVKEDQMTLPAQQSKQVELNEKKKQKGSTDDQK
ncbi:MAG: hypothetical protein Kow00108_05280 [Calditrichia bacterium]